MTVFRTRIRKAGGHSDVTVFAAESDNRTFANIGTLTCTPEEADALRERLDHRTLPVPAEPAPTSVSVADWLSRDFDED